MITEPPPRWAMPGITMLDSQSRMEDFWLGQAVLPGPDPEELTARYEAVTMEQVVAAANQITPHTIYFLKGKEAQPID